MPPDTVSVVEPVLPLHVGCVVDDVTVNAAGCVMVMALVSTAQPAASVTV